MDSWEDFFLRRLHPTLWLAWLIYWLISARKVKRTVRRETFRQRLIYALPLALSVLLFTQPSLGPLLWHHIWEQSFTTYWIGTALLIGGLAFSIWARRILGANWSGTVTVKKDHELITSGPYRLVRHPIYTGLLLALTGSAVSMDRWSGVFALIIVTLGLWIKLLREEQFMRETFGENYAAYCARTKRLVPFLL